MVAQMNVMELAIESGLIYYGMGKERARFIHYLEAFANLIAAHEREECAKVCESHVRYPSRLHFAAAIRARGTT
jgi:hypothetical protein